MLQSPIKLPRNGFAKNWSLVTASETVLTIPTLEGGTPPKYVLLTNWGGANCVVRPGYATTLIPDTDLEVLVLQDGLATRLFILNVAGFTHLAARSLVAVTELRVTPLENF